MNRHDYEGLKMLDPQCEPDYLPLWEVSCDTCGCESKLVEGVRPITCPDCNEDDLDALTITEVTP